MSEQNRPNRGERPLPAAWAADFIRVESVPDDKAEMVPNDEPSTTPNRVPATRGWCWLWNGLELYVKTIRIWIAPLATLVTLYVLVLSALLAMTLSLGSSWLLLISGVTTGVIYLLATLFSGMLMTGLYRQEIGHHVTLGYLLASLRKSFFRLMLIGLLLALFGAVQSTVIAAILLNAFAEILGALTFLPVFAEIAAALYSIIPFGTADLIASYHSGVVFGTLVLLLVPLRMATFFAPALVIFGNVSVTQAMRRSFVGCRRNLLPLTIFAVVWYIASMALRFLIASISQHLFPFALFVTNTFTELAIILPTLICASYLSYREVFSTNDD